jgi:hypothetical protein
VFATHRRPNVAPSPRAGLGPGGAVVLRINHPAARPLALGDATKTECPKISTACTTQLHDRQRDKVSLDEVERIVI